eukprot:Partr_v1_DN28056_c4_g1_i3_m57650 putative CTD (Carboxy-terminal domain, RNA polymerase II, polypeptide A) small
MSSPYNNSSSKSTGGGNKFNRPRKASKVYPAVDVPIPAPQVQQTTEKKRISTPQEYQRMKPSTGKPPTAAHPNLSPIVEPTAPAAKDVDLPKLSAAVAPPPRPLDPGNNNNNNNIASSSSNSSSNMSTSAATTAPPRQVAGGGAESLVTQVTPQTSASTAAEPDKFSKYKKRLEAEKQRQSASLLSLNSPNSSLQTQQQPLGTSPVSQASPLTALQSGGKSVHDSTSFIHNPTRNSANLSAETTPRTSEQGLTSASSDKQRPPASNSGSGAAPVVSYPKTSSPSVSSPSPSSAGGVGAGGARASPSIPSMFCSCFMGRRGGSSSSGGEAAKNPDRAMPSPQSKILSSANDSPTTSSKSVQGGDLVSPPVVVTGKSVHSPTVVTTSKPAAGQDGAKNRFLLRPLAPEDNGKKCLVLDLDETLIHSSFKPVANPDFIIPVEIEGNVHNVYVLKRPFVDEFLARLGPQFEVVIFTASLSKYADPVIDNLDKQRVVTHRLFREACFNHRGSYVKDLSQLGRDLRGVIILDNAPASYLFHPTNAVPVTSWFNDPEDTELNDLIEFLEDLKHVS